MQMKTWWAEDRPQSALEYGPYTCSRFWPNNDPPSLQGYGALPNCRGGYAPSK
ncbi:MAG: hypothetical protein KGZ25_14855 [Planctomycetes bacterium]|nr:hypothetical protein [Planctomycetota bacterium]